jgi:YD repeat-containing protein
MGRLATAAGLWEQPQGNPSAVTWEYRYDPLGNLREQVNLAGGSTSHTWTYGDAARPRFLTQFKRFSGGVLQWTDTMTPDAAGNPATINGAQLIWNGQSRLRYSPSTTWSYYDVFGRKVIDDVPGAAYLLYPSEDFLYVSGRPSPS